MQADQTSPNSSGRNYFGSIARVVVLLGLALLVILIATPGDPPVVPTDPPTDDAAVMARIAACRDAPLSYLIAHTSDNDWRVRAAAYAELAKHAPIEKVPLRDTPIDQRETILLDWLGRNKPNLASNMCEWYTVLSHLRFGGPLVQRCLACHVGAEPTPQLGDTRCIQCHETIHQQWAGTAHANSLSHLQLLTIDPATRQQTPYDFGERKGMSCVACHTPMQPTASAPDTGGPDEGCVAAFETVSCGTCHSEAQAQWQTWRDTPRYRRAVWPPGALERSDDEPKGCAGCHMPGGEHLWAARRSIPVLQSGLAMSVSRGPDGRAVITLRNLAGHNYPTGTTRRALHLYAQLDDEPERLIATLADALPDAAADPSITGPALSPGELRLIPLPGRPTRVQARVVYARNRFAQDAYTVAFASIDHNFPATIGADR